MKYSAPSVSYPMGRSRFHWLLTVGMWLFGWIVALTWFLQSERPMWTHGLMACMQLLLAILLWRDWLSQERGVLRWDGRDWTWVGGKEDRIAQVFRCLDFQHIALLKLVDAAGGRRWVWAHRAASPGMWLPLRRALTAHSSSL